MILVDVIRQFPGGDVVPDGTTVVVKTDYGTPVTLGSPTTTDGVFTYSQNGHPGPHEYSVTYGGRTLKHKSKSTGTAGTAALYGLPTYFRLWNDGVLPSAETTPLQVTATGGGMGLTLAKGHAVLDGMLWDMVTSSMSLGTIPAAHATLPRITLVVLEVALPGQADEGRAEMKLLTGVAAASPTDPALTNSAAISQMAIARVTVPAAVTVLNNAMISQIVGWNATLGRIVGFSTPTLNDGTITTQYLADGSVTTPKLAANAVDNTKILDDAVNGAKIADASIGNAHIASPGLSGAAIATAAITASHIQDGQVGASELAALAVGTTNIQAAAITASKIQDAQVTLAKISPAGALSGQVIKYNGTTVVWGTDDDTGVAPGSIGTTDIADDAITAAKIQAGAVGSSEIAADAVGNSELADDAVQEANISPTGGSNGDYLKNLGTSVAWAALPASSITMGDDIFFARTDAADVADTGATVGATWETAYTKTYTLPAGTWTMLVFGQVAIKRVSAGDPQIRLTVNGTVGGTKSVGHAGASQFVTMQSSMFLTGVAAGARTYTLEYAGGSGDGGTTTSADNPMLTMIAYRTA
jgi:hypothetical protein